MFFYFLGESENSDGMTGRRKFCCWQLLRDLSDHWLVLPKQALLMGQGNMVHGCYYPLSKSQLEWQISSNDITKHVEKELAKSMQVRLLCSNSVLANINAQSAGRVKVFTQPTRLW